YSWELYNSPDSRHARPPTRISRPGSNTTTTAERADTRLYRDDGGQMTMGQPRSGRAVTVTSMNGGQWMTRRPESTARRYGKVFDEMTAEDGPRRPAYPVA